MTRGRPGTGPAADRAGGGAPAASDAAASGGGLAGGAQPGDQQAAGGAGQRPAPAGPPRSRWKAVFFLLATAGIVAGAAWALLDSRFLIVRSVQVAGVGRLVSRAQVTAAAGIRPGLPLIRVNAGDVARRVERIQQVEKAWVSRDWPDAVTITVRQRTPVFAVADGGGFDLVDAFGVVVTRAARQPAGLPQLAAGGPVGALRGSPAVRAAAAVLRELPPVLASQLRVLAAGSPDAVTLRLASGVTIVWGGPERAAEKARELAILMRTHARRYDVSGPGTAMTQG
jgi:cell division protein FtsQ